MGSIFTPEELAEIAAADAQIEAEFELTLEERLEIDAQNRALKVKDRRKAEKRRAYYQANREAIAAYQRAYYQANREEIAEYKRAYYQKHKEEINRKQRDKRTKERKTGHGRADAGDAGANRPGMQG